MQLSAQKVRYEPLRSVTGAQIAASVVGPTPQYLAVGTGFANPVRILKVVNNTDADLIISFDGVTDMDMAPAASIYIYDYCSDKSDQAGNLEHAQGTILYVKYTGTAPTNGKSFYVIVIYASTI